MAFGYPTSYASTTSKPWRRATKNPLQWLFLPPHAITPNNISMRGVKPQLQRGRTRPRRPRLVYEDTSMAYTTARAFRIQPACMSDSWYKLLSLSFTYDADGGKIRTWMWCESFCEKVREINELWLGLTAKSWKIVMMGHGLFRFVKCDKRDEVCLTTSTRFSTAVSGPSHNDHLSLWKKS
jgi:hypothetical protein